MEAIFKVQKFSVSLAMPLFAPLGGIGYSEPPEILDKKRAIIYVKNTDIRWFGYALFSSLHPLQVNAQKADRYLIHLADSALDKISYPVLSAEVPVIDEQLKLKINIFPFYVDTVKARYPL